MYAIVFIVTRCTERWVNDIAQKWTLCALIIFILFAHVQWTTCVFRFFHLFQRNYNRTNQQIIQTTNRFLIDANVFYLDLLCSCFYDVRVCVCVCMAFVCMSLLIVLSIITTKAQWIIWKIDVKHSLSRHFTSIYDHLWCWTFEIVIKIQKCIYANWIKKKNKYECPWLCDADF